MDRSAHISLDDLFPAGKDGERGPLPKQEEFLRLALDVLAGPKYVRYVGGIGSGKSLIGCITMLAWCVQFPGTYLIARQYYPELKDTTYQTFLDICPEELILEHRVADKLVRIRSNGGVATILFRPLEEPDKLRSLNLNAFYIDEANQVSEAAFVLLQGRLRGKYVRKGILTQNTGGMDWSWRWFVKKDMMKDEKTKRMFYNIKAPSTENVHLPEGYVETMLSTWTDARIQREIYANEESFEGQVYNEFRQDIHVVQPFAIPKEWTRVVGADHGYRNPAAWVWGAVDQDENIYIYREFYEREWDIEEICKGKRDPETGKRTDPGVYHLNHGDKLEGIYIDPATKAKRGTRGGAEFDQYAEHLPANWPLITANNRKEAGIDRVKQYMKVSKKNGKPKIFIFNTCENLISEIITYRYKELGVSRQGLENEKEEPIKNNDHACDALRYLVMSRPEPVEVNQSWYEKTGFDYTSLEARLHRELEASRTGKADKGDPFGSW